MSNHEEEGTSEQLPAEEEEDYTADTDPWVTFDGRRTPRAEFKDWLDSNRPTRTFRHGEPGRGAEPVGWIAVFGPASPPPAPAERGDAAGLREDWEQLLGSGRPVTFETVKELALNRRVMGGEWRMRLDTGFKVDHAWGSIARAVLDGKVPAARVSPYRPGARHLICVPGDDFTDVGQVVRLDAGIRAVGVKCPLAYRPDAYAYLGLDRPNRFELCPVIYESRFDLECVPRRSRILSKVTMTELT